MDGEDSDSDGILEWKECFSRIEICGIRESMRISSWKQKMRKDKMKLSISRSLSSLAFDNQLNCIIKNFQFYFLLHFFTLHFSISSNPSSFNTRWGCSTRRVLCWPSQQLISFSHSSLSCLLMLSRIVALIKLDIILTVFTAQ